MRISDWSSDGCSSDLSVASGEPDFFRHHWLSDEQETTRRMQIIVRDNNVDQALRALKKKLQREGVYREMKLRRHYEKPSEKRARERAAAVRRARKMERTEEHTSELQSLMCISYAVFCLKK